jgi:hypothetical protein
MHTEFRPLDVIEWCGDEYVVLENRGYYGIVVETFNGGQIIDNFHWLCGDQRARRIGRIGPSQ